MYRPRQCTLQSLVSWPIISSNIVAFYVARETEGEEGVQQAEQGEGEEANQAEGGEGANETEGVAEQAVGGEGDHEVLWQSWR